jgi:hypothetical protein
MKPGAMLTTMVGMVMGYGLLMVVQKIIFSSITQQSLIYTLKENNYEIKIDIFHLLNHLEFLFKAG